MRPERALKDQVAEFTLMDDPPGRRFEPDDGGTQVIRWLVLDVTMPALVRPFRRLITRAFDNENVRTMAAVKQYAEEIWRTEGAMPWAEKTTAAPSGTSSSSSTNTAPRWRSSSTT